MLALLVLAAAIVIFAWGTYTAPSRRQDPLTWALGLTIFYLALIALWPAVR